MAITDHTRRRLYAAFEEHFGQDLADALMELLPPGGWSDVARQSDILATRGEIAEVRGEIAQVRGEISEVRGEISEVRGEVAQLRADMNTEFAKVRDEIADLREEFRVFRSGLFSKVALTQVLAVVSAVGATVGAGAL